jgi:ClpP class serine protease
VPTPSPIFVNRTSGVGSIGVIATHIDQSAYDKKEGIKYTTIFAGDKKNDLSPHEPISDGAIAD